ncbi:MAG: ABC transporter permease [Streptosporangiaceae bacterium]
MADTLIDSRKAPAVGPVETPGPAPVRPGHPVARRIGLGAWRAVRNSLSIVLFLGMWETVPRIGLADPVFLPPFSEVLVALRDLAGTGELWTHTEASLIRSFAGFAISIGLGIPLGLVLGWYTPLANFFNPVLEVFRNTAALALLPVFVLILGIGETSKISIVVFACFWPILLNTVAGVKGVDPLLIKSARSMGLSAFRLFQKVILPAAVPTIFTGIRLAGAYSILILVAAEMVGAKEGLGYLINASQFNFRIPDMYAGIVAISAIGLAFNWILLRVERRFSTWRTTS